MGAVGVRFSILMAILELLAPVPLGSPVPGARGAAPSPLGTNLALLTFLFVILLPPAIISPSHALSSPTNCVRGIPSPNALLNNAWSPKPTFPTSLCLLPSFKIPISGSVLREK